VGRVARVLIAAAVAVPLLASAPGPAVACTCMPLDAHQIVRRADAIIAGRVTNEVELDPTHTRSVVQVQGVYKGHVPATVNVDADLGPGGGSTCAVLYPVGSEVDPMVLVRAQGGSYAVDPCLIGTMPHVRALLGDARPPPPASPSPSPVPVPIAGPIAGPTPVPGMSWPAVVAGLVLAVALIVAAVRWSVRGAAETASPFDDLPAGAGGGPGSGSDPDDGAGAVDPPEEDASG
jgi:hypothetical protein